MQQHNGRSWHVSMSRRDQVQLPPSHRWPACNAQAARHDTRGGRRRSWMDRGGGGPHGNEVVGRSMTAKVERSAPRFRAHA
jgi:hypothetical protein